MFDVVVIGGGVIGGTILRELTKYKLSVCMLEKEEDELFMNKCSRFTNKLNEIERIESEINENEKIYEKKQKEMIVKFYLLNQEKNNKIKLLQDELLSKPD